MATVAAATLAGTTAPPALAADDCPNAAVRAQQGSSYLPQCRAYEKVSPDDKSGAGIQGIVGTSGEKINGNAAYLRADGERIYYEANNAFGGAVGGNKGLFFGDRTASGWTTISRTPAFAGRTPTVNDIPGIEAMAVDLSRSLYSTNYPLNSLDQGIGANRVAQSTDLYRQEADGTMTWLSPTVGTGPGTPDVSKLPVEFKGSNGNLSRVLMMTQRRLTTEVADETTWHLYLYEDGKPTRLVTRETTANGGGPMTVGTAKVFSLISLSPAGSHVVFNSGANGVGTTYMREHADDPARARTVVLNDLLAQGTGGRTCSSVSAVDTSGVRQQGVVRFECSSQLTDEPLSGGVGTYERNLETGALRLLGPDDLAPASPEFFETASGLVPEDQNGVMDVYQRIDGTPHLISSGTDALPAELVGATPDGQSVFLTTANSLVPEDTDGGIVDLYVARIGGGFLVPETTPECRVSCQGPATVVPNVPTVASVNFVGAGNLMETAGSAVPGKLSTKAKTAKGTAATVSVRVPGQGSVRVSGSGLRAETKTTSKAGTVRVIVRLSDRGRSTLAREGRVSVRATVRFVPSSGKAQSQRVSLTFTRTAKAKKGASRTGAVRAITSGKDGR